MTIAMQRHDTDMQLAHVQIPVDLVVDTHDDCRFASAEGGGPAREAARAPAAARRRPPPHCLVACQDLAGVACPLTMPSGSKHWRRLMDGQEERAELIDRVSSIAAP